MYTKDIELNYWTAPRPNMRTGTAPKRNGMSSSNVVAKRCTVRYLGIEIDDALAIAEQDV